MSYVDVPTSSRHTLIRLASGLPWPGGEVEDVGGAALLTDETNGFATDFTYPTDANRVAKKVAGVVTEYGLDGFWSNSSTSPKLVYDISGNLVWSPHNLVIQSENLVSASWALNLTPVVTAHTIQDDNAAGSEFITSTAFTTVAGETYTAAAWFLKDANTSRFPAFAIVSGGLLLTTCLNTSTGAILDAAGTTLSGTSSVADAGTHWRVSITFVGPSTNGTMRIQPAHGTVLGTASTAAVGTVTVEKVQVNRGAVLTAYLLTTTAARYGLAIDYDPVTHAPKGLLVEPAATNLLLNNTTLSTQSVTVTAVAHTLSFWGTGTITLTGTSTAGPLVGTGASNRVSLTFTPTAGSLTCTVSGTVTRGQLEIGTVATSPIPTFAATATRTADVYNVTPASINHSATAGSWMAETDNRLPAVGQRIIAYSSGGVTAPLYSVSSIQLALVDGTNLVKSWAAAGAHKEASAFQASDRAVTCDGLAVATDAGSTTNLLAPGALIYFGSGAAGAGSLNGYMRKVRYVPRRKSNAELVTETT